MTPRIKTAYRHFNAFLQYYQCKQLFWRTMQKKANDVGQIYPTLKIKLLCCSRPEDWFIDAFSWLSYPLDKPNLTWCDLSRSWDVYCRNHNYFVQ